jgi:hypothetical protein
VNSLFSRKFQTRYVLPVVCASLQLFSFKPQPVLLSFFQLFGEQEDTAIVQADFAVIE